LFKDIDLYGMNGLTVVKTAKEVGFGESTLYRRFKSKRDIFVKILNQRRKTSLGFISKNLLSNFFEGIMAKI